MCVSGRVLGRMKIVMLFWLALDFHLLRVRNQAVKGLVLYFLLCGLLGRDL